MSSDSTQLELFAEFRLGFPHMSRVLPRWDLLPLFVFSRQNQLSPADPSFANDIRPRLHTFSFRGETFTVEVKAAQVTRTGRFVFPGEREQLVAAAVRALPVREPDRIGIHSDTNNTRLVGIACTTRQLRAELAATGHTMSHAEVSEALEILTSTNIAVYRCAADRDKEAIFNGHFYSGLFSQGDKRWIMLNVFESELLVGGEYRAINYERFSSLSDPVARWLFQYLHAEHRGARLPSFGEEPKPFWISLDDLLARGIISRAQELRKTIVRIRNALGVLREADVLADEPEDLGYREELAKAATGGRQRLIGARWGLYLAVNEVEAIIDENAEAKYRESYQHLSPAKRLESMARARANLGRRRVKTREV